MWLDDHDVAFARVFSCQRSCRSRCLLRGSPQSIIATCFPVSNLAPFHALFRHSLNPRRICRRPTFRDVALTATDHNSAVGLAERILVRAGPGRLGVNPRRSESIERELESLDRVTDPEIRRWARCPNVGLRNRERGVTGWPQEPPTRRRFASEPAKG